MAEARRKPHDLTLEGQKFGRLTIITWIPTHERRRHWLCECECGERRIVDEYRLTSGYTKSCGCLRSEPWARKHGDKGSRLYGVWRAMKKRCYQTASINYHNYGGRGIVMCDEWRDDYRNFKAWALVNGYEEGLSIDRIDNDDIYKPSNCQWTTRLAQNSNRRNTLRIVVHGEEMTIGDASRKYGVDYHQIKRRIYKGYAPEDAVKAEPDPLNLAARGRAMWWSGAASNDIEKPTPPGAKA